jgi:N utilization substance protein A
MEGMERRLAFQLASNDIITMEDLAELSVPDFIEIVPEVDEETAAALIMTARAPWFEEAEAEG